MKTRLALAILFFGTVCALENSLDNWRLESSSNLQGIGGNAISLSDYDDSQWLPVQVPCTVMACLLQNKVYTGLYFGMNMASVNTTQFDIPWWYRTEFQASSSDSTKTFLLDFRGINYKANIFVNGALIANESTAIGTFRYFEFDITSQIIFGQNNALAVEIIRPIDLALPDNNNSTDLAITFVDWTVYPQDSNMGLWRSVHLKVVDAQASMAYPVVVTTVLSEDYSFAELMVMIEVTNHGEQEITGALTVNLLGDSLTQKFYLEGNQRSQIIFNAEEYPLLDVKNPVLWWPWQMGEPNMHNITFQLQVGSTISQTHQTKFGIRQANSFIDQNTYRRFTVNNQLILVRGGGYSPDLFLRSTHDWHKQHFVYMRDMNLNAIRLEGKMENDDFFDLADEMGMLVLPGWCCCDAWQHWDVWGPAQYDISRESLRSQVKRLRIHPSILTFLYSSDELPPEEVELNYLPVFDEEYWPASTVASASEYTSNISGDTGVKMTGPYSWVPPNYWLEDNGTYGLGGAYGFFTEGGPGENPLTYESLVRTLDEEYLWPINEQWNYHCANPIGMFRNLDHFIPPLYARYGNATSAVDFSEKSQVAAYEGHRAFFEGYSRNKYLSTGLIQWMQNNAWPQMLWHLYDYYMNPGGSYFGTKKACEPLHIMYSYNDSSIWVINSLYETTQPFKAIAQAYNIPDNSLIHETSMKVASVGPDSATNLFTLPTFTNTSEAYFLRLQIVQDDNIISNNVYWLSVQPDVLDWNASTWYRTPCSSFADFTSLQKLPAVDVKASLVTATSTTASVAVSNPSDTTVAFFIRLRLAVNGTDILPILWEDNYFSLWPGESIDVQATYELNEASPNDIELITEVWNSISGAGKNSDQY
eukprot:TRINITY_DN5716_c0_g1_i1.p1 TRINITY_DN5716_c0_g1~~TRINITY_DN5716_c0_g1_i1.p1  ORF type:complete len:872 (-),score=202.83 TRINITY_DN5716_c0_g1_i1:1-2616(-)